LVQSIYRIATMVQFFLHVMMYRITIYYFI
jgi:hypothetical protein